MIARLVLIEQRTASRRSRLGEPSAAVVAEMRGGLVDRYPA